MSELFVGGAGGRLIYPHFADGLAGYLPNWGKDGRRHPLNHVEVALRQDLHTTYNDSLRLFSFQVGQIANSDRKGTKIYEWEHTIIAKEFEKLKDPSFEQPLPSWRRADFAEYYIEVRAAEAEKLRGQVIALAGHVAVQNQIEPLFVAREARSPESSGWLAPLIGLSIDTNHDNDYHEQVHDVIPVVHQTNGEEALLRGATAALYTAYAPFKGVSQ